MKTAFNKLMITVYIVSCFNGCSGQSDIDNCKAGSKNARSNLDAYYKSSDTASLHKALHYTEQALTCKETRLQAVEMKISILMLLKNYKTGCAFIDSLQHSDFSKVYKKKMSYNFCKAMGFEANGDTANAKNSYTDAINYVRQYIDSTSKEQIDLEAYHDLYFLKSKIAGNAQIVAELEKLVEKYPLNKDFINALKSSFDSIK